MFTVTTLDMNKLPLAKDGSVDYSKDFFGKHTSLTVSGQLEGEQMCIRDSIIAGLKKSLPERHHKLIPLNEEAIKRGMDSLIKVN